MTAEVDDRWTGRSARPASPTGLVDRDRGGVGDIEAANLAELWDEGDAVACGERGRSAAPVFVADHERDVGLHWDLVEGKGIARQFDRNDLVAVGLGCFDRRDAGVELGPGEVSGGAESCLLYTSPSPRDRTRSRMPSSA